jgi:UDP-glucuronate 4-epimerase
MVIKKRILITGTAGFIGFHLVKKLVNEGYEIIGIDNINDYYEVELKYGRLKETGIDKEEIEYAKVVNSSKYENYRFIKLNLEDKEKLDELFEKERFDIICNLAAQAGVRYSITHPYSYINSNILGFMNLLEASKNNKIEHFIYASSSSVYGLNKEIPFKETDKVDKPISLYAATKKADELFAHTYSHLYGLKTTGLRFFTVYGPWGRPDMAAFKFVRAIFEGKAIDVYNYGKMERDFTYIDDIIEGVYKVILKKEKRNSLYKIYNIGNSSPVGLMDFIKAIEKATGKEAKKKFLPMQLGDVPSTYADVSGLMKNFGYKPYTSVEEGVKEFVEWYKRYYSINNNT